MSPLWLVVVGVVVVIGILLLRKKRQAFDEDERPPIIVSSGSLIIEVPDRSRDSWYTPIKPNKKGKFHKRQSGIVYRHAGNNEGNDKTVSSLRLTFGHGDTIERNESGALTLHIVTTLGEVDVNIQPKPGGSGKTDVNFTFQTAVMAPRDHRLELTGGHKPVSATYTVGSSTKTFTFDENDGWVQIWAE